jgi:hypothetical protein
MLDSVDQNPDLRIGSPVHVWSKGEGKWLSGVVVKIESARGSKTVQVEYRNASGALLRKTLMLDSVDQNPDLRIGIRIAHA